MTSQGVTLLISKSDSDRDTEKGIGHRGYDLGMAQVGRPRKANGAKTKDGYQQVTVGPPGNSKRVYKHRAEAGLANVKGSKGGGMVVDHRNANRTSNGKANLHVISKSENTAKGNRRVKR